MAKSSNRNNTRRSNSSARQIQEVLESIEKLNEQMVTTLSAVTNAANMTSIVMGQQVSEWGPTMQEQNRQANSNRPMVRGYTPIRFSHGTGAQHGLGDERPPLGRGISGIRHQAAHALHRRVGTPSGSTFQRSYDQQGNHIGYLERTASGRIVQRMNEGPNANPVSDQELAGAATRARTSGILGSFGEGGVMAGMRAVPYLGAAFLGAEAIHEGATFVANQRAANAQWQNIYGGSNVGTGISNRVSQLGFQLGNLFSGGLSWEQSKQAFQGVSALGYGGSSRSQDLSFITQNYKDFGTSVSESLQLIQTAASNLNEGLNGLQQGLQNTRDMAIETGQAATVGTQQLQQTYSTLTGGGYAGTGLGITASNIAQLQTSMGRFMQGTDLSNMLNNPAIFSMAAQRSNMTPDQFYNAIISGNGNRVTGGLQGALQQTLSPVLFNSQAQAVARQYMTRLGQGNYQTGQDVFQTATGATKQDYWNQLYQLELQSNALPNPEAIVQYAQALGIKGANSPQRAFQLAASASPITGEMTYQRQRIDYKNKQELAPNIQAGITQNEARAQAQTNQVDMQGSPPEVPESGGMTYDPMKKGANPTVYSLDQEIQKTTDHADDNYFVTVHVGGKPRVVTWGTAKKYYMDQIAKGDVTNANTGTKLTKEYSVTPQKTFYTQQDIQKHLGKGINLQVSGGYQLQNTERPTSGWAQRNPAGTDATKVQDEAGQRQGVTPQAFAQYRATHAAQTKAKETGQKVTLTINAGPELKQLLTFQASGNVAIANNAAQYGQIPTGTYTPGVG